MLEGSGATPVVGATVEARRPDSVRVFAATSDEQGWFQLDVPAGGVWQLTAAHPSYVTVGADSVVVGAHEIVSVVLRMGIAAIPIERLVVTARSGDRLAAFYRRAERGGFATFLTRADIERRRAALPSRLVQMVPGVRLTDSTDRLGSLISMRGSMGVCLAEVLLDGLPVAQELDLSIDDFTAPEMLEGVEIYPPHAVLPREFPVVGNDCGVIAFWSRREAFRPLTWARVIVAGAVGILILLVKAL